MTTAIIGLGWVGKAVQKLFPNSVIYDRHNPNREEVNKCDIAFICVPTPNLIVDTERPGSVLGEGRLNISIVEENIAWIECPLIVIRSTVNPGTTDYLSKKYNKQIIMQPEYLGETPNHPMYNQDYRPFLILGGNKKDVRKLINIYTTVYNANTSIRQVTAYEAEIIKLSENRAILFKTLECQELYDACEAANVDYYTIRDAVYGDDPRFNLWWTFIMADKPRGCISKCIPKDPYAWCAWAESFGYKPEITRAILERNKLWIQ
jgi:UDPglucose 6-dehydrogenase